MLAQHIRRQVALGFGREDVRVRKECHVHCSSKLAKPRRFGAREVILRLRSGGDLQFMFGGLALPKLAAPLELCVELGSEEKRERGQP